MERVKRGVVVACMMASVFAGCDRAAPSVAPPAQVAAASAPCAAPGPQAGATPAIPATAAAPTPAPAPAPVKVATPKPSARPAELKVKRLVVAEGVADREPVEAGTSFKAGEVERIYAFVELENASREPGQVTVAFEPAGGGGASGNVTLEVGGAPRWRTWAYTRAAKRPGAWTAVVRSADGEVLARTPFEVTL